MNKLNEIGSIFWLNSQQIAMKLEDVNCKINFLSSNERAVFTSTGRGAIKYLLKNLNSDKKVALLPNYTCDSVLLPFIDSGYKIHFYKINKDLTIDLDYLIDSIKKISPNLLFLQDYFGFDTLSSLRPYHNFFRSKGLITIKDFTHSWLSDFNTDEFDYYVASLHKWLEIPDGGVALSIKNPLHASYSKEEQFELIDKFIQVYTLKNKYIETLNDKFKIEYRSILPEITKIFDKDREVYSISKLSKNVINNTDFSKIKSKRRSNYLELLRGLKSSKLVTPVFSELGEGITPLYFTIYVNGDRHKIQGMLADNDIYCPIIWPLPDRVVHYYSDDSLSAFEHVLSIPCDQRYELSDMTRVVDAFENYQNNHYEE